MSNVLLAPIVGQYHRPPARTILDHLPAGAELILVPQPDNPHDPNAIQVLISADAITNSPAVEAMTQALPLQGATLEQVLSTCPLQLGFIAASSGKPLQKAREDNPGVALVGNTDVLDWMKDPDYIARLVFSAAGAPMVQISTRALEGAEYPPRAPVDEDQLLERGDDQDLTEQVARCGWCQ